MSSRALQSPLPATRSRAHREVQRACSGTSSHRNRGPSEVPPTAQEVGLPSLPASGTEGLLWGPGEAAQHPMLAQKMAKHDPGEGTPRVAFGGTCHGDFPMPENHKFSSKRDQEGRGRGKVPSWEVTMGTGMKKNSKHQCHLRSLGSRDTSDHSSPLESVPQNQTQNVNGMGVVTLKSIRREKETTSLRKCPLRALKKAALRGSSAQASGLHRPLCPAPRTQRAAAC